jgi:pyruvate ferredoxin oxidoreductase beta subunit
MKNPAPLEEFLAPQKRFAGIDPKTVKILKQGIAQNIQRLAKEESGVC